MALTLAQLLSVPSLDTERARVLQVLQGLGLVVRKGAGAGSVPLGTGTLSLSGVPLAPYAVVFLISTSGELGAGAACQLSTDGGATYGTAVLLPSNGVVAVGGSGVTATFKAGPTGAGTSFVAGDTYSFSLTPASFPTAQQPGSMGRALWEIEAQTNLDLRTLVAAIAAGGLLYQSSGAWLDLLAYNVYGLPRNPAVVTRGSVTLTDAASAGPFTVTAGGITFASTSGVRFSNTAGFTLSKGGTLVVPVQAESPGAAYNVPNGSITSIVAGTLPGVTVTNPDPGSGTWYTTQGVDVETDAALQARCASRWAALGIGATADYYTLLAKTAAPNVTRVSVVQDSVQPAQVNMYLAGASSGSPGGDVALVVAAVQPRLPLTATLNAVGATNAPVPLTATIYYRGSLGAVQAAVAANVQTYIQSIPISTSGVPQTAYLAELEAAIMEAPGVVNTTLSGADTAIAAGSVATVGSQTLTWTAVP